MKKKVHHKKGVAREITIRYRPTKISVRPINTPKQAYWLIKKLWSKELKELQEQIMVLFLDIDSHLIGYRLLNTGTHDRCLVDVKLLVTLALKTVACHVIVAHNHPSDDFRPSKDDIEMTVIVKYLLRIFNISLADHVILSKSGYYSFAEKRPSILH